MIDDEELSDISAYYPYGMRHKGSGLRINESCDYLFNGKEIQSDFGLGWYDYGARFYNPSIATWNAIDPLAEKYSNITPYAYVANNPIKNIDPDGRYFIGSNEKAVNVTYNKRGKIRLGKNASKDLQRMAKLINKSGSKTALSQFKKIAGNDTKVDFSIKKGKSKSFSGELFGYFQPHDEGGKALEWDIKSEKFNGDAAVQFDKENGNLIYKEATMTLYEGNFDDNLKILQDEYSLRAGLDGSKLNKEDALITVFSHEAEHGLDRNGIEAIQNRQQGKTSDYDVEKIPTAIEYKVAKEIIK